TRTDRTDSRAALRPVAASSARAQRSRWIATEWSRSASCRCVIVPLAGSGRTVNYLAKLTKSGGAGQGGRNGERAEGAAGGSDRDDGGRRRARACVLR